MKSEVVSYIYDQPAAGRKASALSKRCNSTLSAQNLMKQDSSASQDSWMKQDSLQFARKKFSTSTESEYFQRQNSANSSQALLKQDSYRSILSKQNSSVSYCDSMKSFSSSIESCNELRKESILRQNFNNLQRNDPKRKMLCKQDTDISLIEGNGGGLTQQPCKGILTNGYNQDDPSLATVLRRQRLQKQNSVISFGEPIKFGGELIDGIFVSEITASLCPFTTDKHDKELVKQDSIVSVTFTDQHEII